ncbi:MAG: QacE family quaternary ammonium compound efflux SMR transporter, partial [Zetaproteobacteria bacterium]
MTKAAAWGWLILAILLEVAGTTAMKLSEGFARLVPSILVFVFYAASMAAAIMATQRLDIGIVYAVWAGLGTALVAMIGVVVFREPFGWMKALGLVCVIAGVVLLHLSEEP